MRGFEPHQLPFGYIPGMYGGNGASGEPNVAGRNSVPASSHPQGSPMRRYPNNGQFREDYARRALNNREEAVRAFNSRLREEREATGE
jgi:hypothetical protein